MGPSLRDRRIRRACPAPSIEKSNLGLLLFDMGGMLDPRVANLGPDWCACEDAPWLGRGPLTVLDHPDGCGFRSDLAALPSITLQSTRAAVVRCPSASVAVSPRATPSMKLEAGGYISNAGGRRDRGSAVVEICCPKASWRQAGHVPRVRDGAQESEEGIRATHR